ncbi:MAG TPA: hypothetical protein PKM57_03615 [Kiritimatiellia bacterium]|nr:hypothetical protein [Kiritimatiellia bacterium]HPS06311.1 hypothetical protein [Kiritimatiellia bacterium]
MMSQREIEDKDVLRRLLALFGVFAVICLLAGASRMCPSAWQLQPFGDVLRVREALSMFVFAPAIGVLFWLLVRAVGQGQSSRLVEVLMVLAVYFIACGMGMHDPMNRIVIVYRGSQALTPELQRTLAYLDDQLGHWIFWGGFVLGTWVFGLQQLLSPLRGRMAWPWRCGFGAVALALLWVMLTNLWDEYPKTRVDLCVVAAAVAVPAAFHLSARRGVGLLRLPVLCVIYPAYIGGIVGTLVCWLVRYGKV